MWNQSSKFYDAVFKDRVQRLTAEQRAEFKRSKSSEQFFEFGRRFYDDDQVWQAVCAVINSLDGAPNERVKALEIEQKYLSDESKLIDVIWGALKVAAETDYHYKFEKRYYEPPVETEGDAHD